MLLHLQAFLQDEAHFVGPDPILRTDERFWFVPHVHQGLLNLTMVRGLALDEVLQPVPARHEQQRSIEAQPYQGAKFDRVCLADGQACDESFCMHQEQSVWSER